MKDDALDSACELAFQVAREGLEANPPINPPAAMRSFLYVAHLPRRAMTVAQRAIEEDPEFRARVLAVAEEDSVGAEGYAWLTGTGSPATAPTPTASTPTAPSEPVAAQPAPAQPAPVQQAPVQPEPVAAPTSPRVDATEASKATIEDELTSLRSLVDRLADERKVVSSSVTDLETEVERRRREASELANELESLKSALATAEADRTALNDASRQSAARVAELETDLSSMQAAVAHAETESTQANSRAANAEQRLADAEQRLAITEEALAEATVNLEAVSAELAEAYEQLGTANAELDTTKSALVGAQARSVSLDAAEAQLVSLESERDGLRGQLSATEQSLADANTSIETITAERDAAVTNHAVASADLDEANAKLEVAEQARVDLEGQLSRVSAQWQELQVELGGLSEQRLAVERELEALSRERETSVASRQALFDDLATQLGRVEAERNVLADQLEQVRGSLDATRNTFKVATTQLNDDLSLIETGISDASETAEAIGDAHRGADALVTNARSNAASEVAPTIENPVEHVLEDAADDVVVDEPAIDEPVADEPVADEPIADEILADEPVADSADVSWTGGEAAVDVDPTAWIPEADATDAVDADIEAADAPEAVVEEADDAETEAPSQPMPLDDMLASYGLGSDDLERPPAELSADSLDASHASTEQPEGEADQSAELDPFAALPLADETPAQEIGADELAIDIPIVEEPAITEMPLTEMPLLASDATDEGLIDDVVVPVAPVPDAQGIVGRKTIVVPPTIIDDPVSIARYVVSVEDVVLLIDGDAVAGMGWPSLPTVERRDALVSYLGDLAADTGAAPDTIFDGSIGEDDALPVSRAVRVRLTASGVEPASALSELVDGYPREWPVAVVTDNPILASDAKARGAAVLDNAQLLDLFIAP